MNNNDAWIYGNVNEKPVKYGVIDCINFAKVPLLKKWNAIKEKGMAKLPRKVNSNNL